MFTEGQIKKEMQEEMSVYYQLAIEADCKERSNEWLAKGCALLDFVERLGIISIEESNEMRARFASNIGYNAKYIQ